MSRDFGGGTAPKAKGDALRELQLDAEAGVEHIGMPWCWKCTKAYGHRYAVESVLVHPAYEVKGVTVQATCHGETRSIRIRGIDPDRFKEGYNPRPKPGDPPGLTLMEALTVQTIPFFTLHPEQEFDFTEVKLKVLAIAKKAYLEEQRAEAEFKRIRNVIGVH